MLTVDGEEASAVRSTSALVINTGGTYHLGGEGERSTVDAAHLPFFYWVGKQMAQACLCRRGMLGGLWVAYISLMRSCCSRNC